MKGTLCSADEEPTGVSKVTFKGTMAEIVVFAQFLCWIAASFRLPRPNEVTSSLALFQDISARGVARPTFEIYLSSLESFRDSPGTCWTPLFPTTVVAYGFPVPIYPGTRGLQLPFDFMLETAGILYDVNLEDDEGNDAGVYFDGISYVLYPTAHIPDQKTVQWHVEDKRKWSKERRRDQHLAPDHEAKAKWRRISNLEILQSSTAILGYCSEAHVQLGTADRARYHATLPASVSHLERPAPVIAGGSSTLGTNILGFVTGSVSPSMKTRTGYKMAKEASSELDYMTVLNTTKDEPIIVFDTEPGNERAWMVPQLSLILEFFNIWALRRGIGDIRYAEPSPDGGEAAKAVLANIPYAQRIVVPKILNSESELQVGDIIKQIYGKLQQSSRGASSTTSCGCTRTRACSGRVWCAGGMPGPARSSRRLSRRRRGRCGRRTRGGAARARRWWWRGVGPWCLR